MATVAGAGQGIGGLVNSIFGGDVQAPQRQTYGGGGADVQAGRYQDLAGQARDRQAAQLDQGQMTRERALTSGYEGNMQNTFDLARSMATGGSNAAQATFRQGADQMASLLASGAASASDPASQMAAMRTAQQTAGAQGTQIANQAAIQQEQFNQFGAGLMGQMSTAQGQQGLQQQAQAQQAAQANLNAQNFQRQLNDQTGLGYEGLGQNVYQSQLQADIAHMNAMNQANLAQAASNTNTGGGIFGGVAEGVSGMFAASDIRAKTSVQSVGLDPAVVRATRGNRGTNTPMDNTPSNFFGDLNRTSAEATQRALFERLEADAQRQGAAVLPEGASTENVVIGPGGGVLVARTPEEQQALQFQSNKAAAEAEKLGIDLNAPPEQREAALATYGADQAAAAKVAEDKARAAGHEQFLAKSVPSETPEGATVDPWGKFVSTTLRSTGRNLARQPPVEAAPPPVQIRGANATQFGPGYAQLNPNMITSDARAKIGAKLAMGAARRAHV